MNNTYKNTKKFPKTPQKMSRNMTNHNWISYGIAALLSSSLAAGCAAKSPDTPNVPVNSGLALTFDIVGDTDVAGMRFEITPVNCADGVPIPGEPAIVVDKDLEDILLPGGIPEFEAVFHPDSGHIFADAFLVVDAGCYDVTTTPLNAANEPSEDCGAASTHNVEVFEGNTTEVLIINQCDADDPGAIDIVSSLNHAPELVNVEFEESKFLERCEVQTICATVTDADKDPLEFVWTPLTDQPLSDPVVVSETQNDDASVTQCVAFTPTAVGRYEVKLEVFDLLTLGGGVLRFEEFFASIGSPVDSHAELTLPFYAAESSDGDGTACEPDPCLPGSTLVCSEVVDLVLLEDLSGSFGDDLPVIQELAPGLHASLVVANPGTRCGLASFIDKPFAPFGATSDFVYNQDLALTDVFSDFDSALSGLSIGSGGDGPESQLEGLLLLARNTAAMGFGTDTARYVVLSTDAPFHVAGDCTTCAVSNNGDGVADANEDYPSIEQVSDALSDANIIPIFAVTSGQVPAYQDLANQLGIEGSSVLELESDSSNLFSVIVEGLSDTCTCEPIGRDTTEG